ncbi:MAG: T9SS type A sorting domain-containing protein [Lewinellaceae bacterium]|nr:T9SS type A sorting domain-containing protein [Lewinellaceae bacterium]
MITGRLKLNVMAFLCGLAGATFLGNTPTFSQTPARVLQIGGEGIDNLSHMKIMDGSDLIIAGVFDDDLALGETILAPVGENDVFLARINGNNETMWAMSIGSDFDDDITGLALGLNDDIYATGSFWLEAQLGDFPLTSTQSPKSIFLTKISASTGTVAWAQKIEGSEVKVSKDMLLNHEEDIILSGFFSGTLFIGDTTLQAASPTDLFVASFYSDGNLNWALNLGISGTAKALTSCILSNDNIVLGGIFNDTLKIANNSMVAETSDDDVFIACFSPEGEALWATKAGGVHEEFLTALQADDLDNIYASGHFVGVINLDDGSSIQSNTGWADLFILKFSAAGEVLNAKRFGGPELQHNTAMEVTDDFIFLTGNFQGAMTIGDNNYDAGNQTAGFITRLDHDLIPQTGWTLKSEVNNVFPTCLTSDQMDNIFIGGAYGHDISGIEALGPPLGLFDIFILGYPAGTVNALPGIMPLPEITVFPNPAAEKIQIRTSLKHFDIQMIDINGRILWQGSNVFEIDVSNLAAGPYFIKIRSGMMEWQGKILVK